MSDSTSPIDTIATAQASKEVTANAAFNAASPAMLYAMRAATTTALTWGYYGGRWNGIAIANGTIPALTASATNYIVANRTTGVVSASTATTNWVDVGNYLKLYSVVTGASTITSWVDERQAIGGGGTFEGGTLTTALNEAPAVVLASAGTVNIGAAAGNSISITGTTTITAFDSIADGAVRRLTFAGVLTLTHNGTSLILPTGANITTAAGDVAQFLSLGSGNWRCVGYTKADGTAVYVAPTVPTETVNAQTGTTYTYLAGDKGRLVTHSNASSIAGTLPQAGVSFPDGWWMDVLNAGVGTLTITPTTSTVDGAASVSLATGESMRVVSDGSNYFTIRGAGGYTLPTASTTVLGGVKVDGSSITIASGVISASGSAPATQTLTDFAQDTGTTSALNYGYKAGVIRDGTTTTSVVAGTIAVTNATTNYVEVSGAGTVSTNTTGFTSGRYPMATVVASGGSITTVTDKRGLITAVASFAGGTLTTALNGAPAVSLASAATVNIGAAAANKITVTGTTTITAFDSIADGAVRSVTFSGALTLTHNGTSLILPGAVSITTAAGDTAEFVSLGSGNWRCVGYTKAAGGPVGVDKARVGRVAAFTTPANGTAKITFDTTSYDTNGIVDLTNSRITPKKPGYYTVMCRSGFLSTATAQRAIGFIYQNGAEISRLQDIHSTTTGTSTVVVGSDVMYFNGTTDYVEMYIYTSTARALDVGSNLSFMSVFGPL